MGCGTGNHLRALVEDTEHKGFGIDPSREMIKNARNAENVQLVEGTAEALPFEDDSFDLVFSVDVIHYVRDTAVYYHEARRALSPEGLVCTVTDSEWIIKNRPTLSHYWPGTVQAELKRYHSIESLSENMAGQGFKEIKERVIEDHILVTDATPYRQKSFSSLHLISEEEFEEGLARMESDLQNGPIQGVSRYICLWGRK